jgi:lipid-binding SYLF domain-containing protein
MSRAFALSLGLSIAAAGFVAGCAHAPKTEAERAQLLSDAQSTVDMMTAKDPSLRTVLDQAVAYVVFPRIGAGGFIIGGAGGKGVLFERGQFAGYASLSQTSIGAQLGGQKYAEVIVLQNQYALDQMRAGKLNLGATASAVALSAGAAASTQFRNGVAVFTQPLGGAMFNVSLSGQQVKLTG